MNEVRAVTSPKVRKRLPAILEPTEAEVGSPPVDVVAYARDHRDAIVRCLDSCGGVLLRGFNLTDVDAASAVLRGLRWTPVEYGLSDNHGGHRPKVDEFFRRDANMTTPETGSQSRLRRADACLEDFLGVSWGRPWKGPSHFGYHNEGAYGNCPLGQRHNYLFPDYLVLFCVEPPQMGGLTVISDCRKVLSRVRRGILKKQKSQGLSLALTKSAVMKFGPMTIATYDYKGPAEVADDVWKGAACPLTMRHPHTGEASFANHLLADGMFAPHPHFSDGTTLSEDDYFHVWKAHVLETTFFSWEKGDLLILDNRLTAHAATSFNREVGRTRELRVALANGARQ